MKKSPKRLDHFITEVLALEAEDGQLANEVSLVGEDGRDRADLALKEDGDRHGGESTQGCAGSVARADPSHRRRQQPWQHRAAGRSEGCRRQMGQGQAIAGISLFGSTCG